ncbi:mannosyltransferase [Neonectria punicea]|uniref:Mannosyltransferase n=1 Tax=Neonectria punicea TaxID=979145 RepID=A0ABR1GNA8_9HYPO
MRLTLRWLAFLVSVVVFLFYLYRSTESGLDSLRAKLPVPSAQEAGQSELHTEQPGTISAFWKQWSRIIHENRPNTKSKVTVKGTARTVSPSEPDEPRQPYRDLVRVSDEDLELLRLSHARFVKELESLKTDGIEKMFQGRGAVMVGGGEYFGPAVISIHMLRRTGSELPVEVFVPNQNEYEKDICERYLPKLNAKCVVLADFLAHGPTGLEIEHYQLKAISLLLSSFAEVLLLDSDSNPLVDPETTIFDTEPYLSHGLITWPDFWGATESPRFWDIAGLSHFPEDLPPTSSESGQLVLNKRTHLATLLLATYYNLYGPEHYYTLLSQGALGQGDKETFMAAAVALNATYYRVKTPVLSLGRHDGERHKGTAMVQHLPLDDASQGQENSGNAVRPAFLHCNTPKMNAGHLVDEGDLLAVDGKSRLRLLGPKLDLDKLFGFDVEDTLWDLLVQTGCELADSIDEWKDRERLCERLTEHHKLVFDEAS